MCRLSNKWILVLLVFVSGMRLATADPVPGTDTRPAAASNDSFLLGPPNVAGPVVVRVRFEFHDILAIDDGGESFDFSGVSTLTWNDPRQAFEPAVEGVEEKVFQGAYQFNEVSTAWYPQLVLVNESGMYEKRGVVLRVRPDGSSTLTETITATAKVELDMHAFPFDRHRLDAVFEVLGFDQDEIVLEVESAYVSTTLGDDVRVPQWTIAGSGMSVRDRTASYAGRQGVSSAFIASVDVDRNAFYIGRLVVYPLIIIVLLSFSVFWMERSSLGDRTSVSFIGILTGVTYQVLVSDKMPDIAYVTLMNGFLNLSFATMCATVVINLVVGALDRKGRDELGDLIDRRCRWIFPLVYFGINFVFVGVALEFY